MKMDMKMSKDDMEHWKMHKKKKGWAMLILGIVVLVNVYWPFMSWWGLLGVVLVLVGIKKLAMPGCCGMDW